ncbi:fructose PTS transporter subunit IIA [Fusobacterium sp.]|uniref:PTS sugar transporter subunit IIA n=1 Tax=Fusobacterium sp. TaxID=68766 RepID=UPI002609A912|nr:fructose PTS transporter subunit IIA [Fusobacterium sp.]
MDLKEFITLEQISAENNLNTKEEFFSKIAEIALKSGIITSEEEVIEGLKAREAKGSTGLLDGFAIPHAQNDTIKRAAVVIVKSSNRVEWESLDEQPVGTAICLLVPKDQAGTTHIDFLTEVSRLLMDDEFRSELNKLNDSKSIYNLLLERL